MKTRMKTLLKKNGGHDGYTEIKKRRKELVINDIGRITPSPRERGTKKEEPGENSGDGTGIHPSKQHTPLRKPG